MSSGANAMRAASAAASLHVAEPAPAYLERPPLVVDSSVVAAVVFGEAGGDEAVRRLSGTTLHAPWLIGVEIGSIALKKLQADKSQGAMAGLAHFCGLAIRRHAVDASSLAALAQRYGLTGYDAAYLLVASELRAPLVTFDRKLATAARRHLALPR